MKILKEIIKKYWPIAIGILLVVILILSITINSKNNGKGTASASDVSVDVCINQDCDYIADGQNDEREITQAIARVLDAGGGTVNIRTGNYNISSSIHFSLSGESLIIKGDGLNTKLTNSMTDSSEDGTMFVASGDGSSLDNLSFRDIYFVGSSNSGAAISLTDIYKAEISDSKLYNFSASGDYGTAIKLLGATELILSNNIFNSNTLNTMISESSTVIYEDRANNDDLFIDLGAPTDADVATSTGGSLSAETFYFKITVTDGHGGESLPSSELSCTTGTEMSGTSTACNLTWTNITGSNETRIWMSTTSPDVYYGYYVATTTGQFSFISTSTPPTSSVIPTTGSAHLVNMSSSGSWINYGYFSVEEFTQGGDSRATSTVNSSETLLSTDFDTENVINYTLNVSSGTLKIPVSSTLESFIPDDSDSREIIINNATNTPGILLTIAENTGIDLQKASSSDAIIPGGYAIIKFLRKANTDIVAFLSIFTP